MMQAFIPVMGPGGHPLMPTIPSRARRWIQTGKATPFWSQGLFCVRLNVAPSDTQTQEVAVGIDPGSKKEGYTVKSTAHTYLNINADAVTHVKQAVKIRHTMRRGRRYRQTPCRKNRKNRQRGSLPPSTKARWQWKLRVARWLTRIFPITVFVVEDVAAKTRKGKRRWNRSFSPLEVGKQWFYAQLEILAPVLRQAGWETKQQRDALGLKKTSRKMAEVFEAHAVDSWVMAYQTVGGAPGPDNQALFCVAPIRVHRRQLHRLQPEAGGYRKPYGGTRSQGFKRGSVVRHPQWGVTYVGGSLSGRISLHRLSDGHRLTQNARPDDCRFLTYNAWKTHWAVLKPKNEGAITDEYPDCFTEYPPYHH